MGWLKKIFGNRGNDEEEVPPEVSVELPKLDRWVEARLHRSFSKILPDIKSGLKELEESYDQLDDELERLKKEELRNPNISEREMQLMEGNRESYIQQHKLFLQQADIPEKLDYRNTSEFCENFEQLLLKLAKSTGRSHMVMSEFYLHNANAINKIIKKMSNNVSEIKEQMQDYDIDVEKNQSISKAVSELQSKMRHLKELKKDLEVLERKLSNSKKMKEKIESNIEFLKKGDSYSEFKKLDKEKEENWEKLKETEKNIEARFSKINKPMRKFEHMAFEELETLKKYIENPMKALAEDEDLKIMKLLASLKKAVEEDKLELKEKDKEKAIQRIDKISEEELKKERERYLKAKQEIKDIDTRMKNIRALQELNDLNYKVEHVNNQIELLEERIEKNRQTQEKIDIPQMKKDVERWVGKAFNVSLTITEDDKRIHS